MCDVPIIADFCGESIECFPGTASKFFLKLLVTVPVAPIITGTIVHFRFHIRCISIHKLLYFNFFSASFCTKFLSAGIATSISVHVFSFLFLIIISGLFAVTSLPVCTALLLLLLLIAIGLSPGGSSYFTYVQSMKLVTNKFKSGELHEKHVVATWNLGNRLSICL